MPAQYGNERKKQKFRMAPDLNVHVFNYFQLNVTISWLVISFPASQILQWNGKLICNW